MTRLSQQLKAKSEELNLFSKGDREKIESKHLPDALAVLDFWEAEGRVIDLGTGGGLPGLALAEARPELEFVLLDARQKKVEAVGSIAEELGLENVKLLWGRIEDLAHEEKWREQFEVATARALAPLPTLLEYAVGFLKEGGRLYAWKGSGAEEELEDARSAMEILGMELMRQHEYVLPDGAARVILEFEKITPLEDAYPRRNGKPKNKPL